jgi:hypothetical protein
MPAIKQGEKRNSYIPRCVAYVMKNEGLDQKAAVGKCEGMYDSHIKHKNSKADNTQDWAESLFPEKEEHDLKKE